MLRLAVAGAHTTILSSLCRACPHSRAGCCVAPPRLAWSDLGRVVALGGRDWLLGEIAAGRLVPAPRGAAWLVIRRGSAASGDETTRACVYLGPNGCTLPLHRRSATCNFYVCEDAIAAGGPEGERARSLNFEMVEALVRMDAEVDRRFAARWPDSPVTFDAALLDWVGATFEELAHDPCMRLSLRETKIG